MNKKIKQRKEIKMPNILKRVIDVLNGSFLGKDKVLQYLPFAAYITLVMVCYISYGHYTEKSVKELNLLERKLKDVKSEHLTWQSDLDSIRQQSSVASAIQEMGLKESTEPLVKIEFPESNK